MKEQKPKCASKVADVQAGILADLNAGRLETATLAESLAMDFQALLGATVPELREVEIDPKAGVTRRMAAAATAIFDRFGDAKSEELSQHPSDVVRGCRGRKRDTDC